MERMSEIFDYFFLSYLQSIRSVLIGGRHGRGETRFSHFYELVP